MIIHVYEGFIIMTNNKIQLTLDHLEEWKRKSVTKISPIKRYLTISL